MKPHRGGLVLTMGILALVFNLCAIPGILAWIWGGADLKEMKSGRMDPSGQGITQAGYIMGIIGTVLVLLGVLLYVFLIVMVAGGAAAGI